MDDTDKIAKAASVAEDVVNLATQKARKLLQDDEDHITRALADALRDVFGEHVASGRFIDVARIPLLCKAVIDTSAQIKDINNKLDNKFVTIERYQLVEKIVYGGSGIILVAVIAAVVGLVLIK